MKQAALLIALLINLSFGSFGQKLLIAVSANAQYAIREIADSIERKENVPIELVVGSSGKLAAQIEQGAPFHIFFSADMEYPQQLCKRGFGIGHARAYAFGSLVVWTLKSIPLTADMSFLKSNEIRKIALPNPKMAPYGKEAIKALKYWKIYEQIKDKIILGESVSQVNQYISLQTCDVGITAKSVVYSSELKRKGRWIEVPGAAYDLIAQGVVILRRGREEKSKDCEVLLNYVFSSEGKAVLKKHGFEVH